VTVVVVVVVVVVDSSIVAGLILSMQSKMQFVQSKMRNCAVQKQKVEDIIVQFSKSILITSLRSSLLNR